MYFLCDFTLIHFQFFRKDPGYFFWFGHLAVDHGDRTDRLVGCQDNPITIQESEQIKAADAAAAAQAEGKDFGDTEYSDFDENYTDTYDKKTDSSADENYKPDLDSWATVNNGD